MDVLLGTQSTAVRGEGYDHVEAIGERHVASSQEICLPPAPNPNAGENPKTPQHGATDLSPTVGLSVILLSRIFMSSPLFKAQTA